jgi:programmed cell death protein 4
LKEYLQSNDKYSFKAAANNLAQLKIHHFNHMLVYQCCLLALDEMADHIMVKLAKFLLVTEILKFKLIIHLIYYLYESFYLAKFQIVWGFRRLYNDLDDLCLEKPAAYILAKYWVKKALKYELIDKNFANEFPEETIQFDIIIILIDN